MIANELFDSCIEDCPEDSVSVISVADMEIDGCKGCDGCKAALSKDDENYPELPARDDSLAQCQIVFKSDTNGHQCVIEDDFDVIRKHLDASDELIVVSPVYFSGTPSQFKAVLDRMQPYFWSNIRSYTKQRRPMTLHVVREGSGPKGYAALTSEVSSAFGASGFRLQRLLDWHGCFDEAGAIMAEPAEVDISSEHSHSGFSK